MTSPLERLQDQRPAVRRIAIMDLLRDGGDAGLTALLTHLPREQDERAALLIVRNCAERKHQPARAVLAQLRDSAAAPAAVAHAALLAHDALEVAARPAPPPLVIDPDDVEADEDQ
ncbi:MAG: hypothetical protein ACK5ZG_09070 [Phycisphaerae bacterium]|jgi:hypothetical protein